MGMHGGSGELDTSSGWIKYENGIVVSRALVGCGFRGFR